MKQEKELSDTSIPYKIHHLDDIRDALVSRRSETRAERRKRERDKKKKS